MKELVGRQFGKYHVLKIIGEGAFGVVYLAKDTTLGRNVALKFLDKDLAGDESSFEQLAAEAKSASRFAHTNICTIYEIDHQHGFIAMPYYEGLSIRKLIDKGPLTYSQAIEITTQVLNGLAKAHDGGIIHRDINPSNLIRTEDGTVIIIDFGLAKLADPSQSTTQRMVKGTVPYMSPEQAMGDRIDHRTDVWSAGVVFYEMVSGKSPFNGDNAQATFYRIINTDPEPLVNLTDSPYAKEIDTIVQRALAKQPDDRFQSCTEFKESLVAIKRRIQQPSQPVYTGQPIHKGSKIKPYREKAKWRRWIIPVLLLSSLLLLWQSFDPAHPTRPVVVVEPILPESKVSEINDAKNLIRSLVMNRLEKCDFFDIHAPNRAGQGDGNYRVVSQLAASGETTSLSLQATDDNTGRILFAETIALSNILNPGNELLSRLNRMAVELHLDADNSINLSAEEVLRRTTSVRSYLLYRQGIEDRLGDQYEEASMKLRKAIALDPDFALAYCELARVNELWNDNIEARKNFDHAMRLADRFDEEIRLEIEFADAKFRYNWDTVLTSLQQLCRLEPKKAEWRFQLGWHYVTHRHDCRQAIDNYEVAVDLTDEPRYHRYVGFAHLECGDTLKAGEQFRRYRALQHDSPIAHDQLGEFYYLSGRYQLALQEFETALNIQDNFSPTLFNLGRLYSGLGQRELSRNHFYRYIARVVDNNNKERGLLGLAELYLQFDEIEQAERAVNDALRLKPDWVAPYWLMGRLALKKGEIDRASQYLGQIRLRLQERQSDFQRELDHHLGGLIEIAMGNFDTGIRGLMNAAEIGSIDNAFFRTELASAFLAAGQFENAKKWAEKALEASTNYPYALFVLGRSYEELEQGSEAMKHYHACLGVLKDADSSMPLLREVQKNVPDVAMFK